MDIDQPLTTNKADYRVPPLAPYKKYRWPCDRVDKQELPLAPQQYTCPETLTKLRQDKYIPMNLKWTRRPIIDPLPDVCDVPKQRVDKHREEVIKQRPRVYMTSAVSIDDVEEPEVRDLLLSYMYTTDMKRAMKQAQDYTQEQVKKNDPMSQECDKLPKVPIPCVVKDEGVKVTIPSNVPTIDKHPQKGLEAWDNKQLRAQVDPMLNFWTRFYQNRVPDEPLTSLIPPETIDRIAGLIENDKLRLPHDTNIAGYNGHMPEATLVDVEKIELPMEHPMHTTNQTVYVNHYDHANNNLEK